MSTRSQSIYKGGNKATKPTKPLFSGLAIGVSEIDVSESPVGAVAPLTVLIPAALKVIGSRLTTLEKALSVPALGWFIAQTSRSSAAAATTPSKNRVHGLVGVVTKTDAKA